MSQRTAVEKEIGEKQFTMYMLGPMVSHELLMDVMKMVGPAIGPMFDVVLSGKGTGEIDIGKVMEEQVGGEFFSKAATALFGGLDKKVLRDIINAFSAVTHIDGVPLDKTFEVQFAGDLGMMYQWLAWGMAVQWGKSFGALASMVGKRAKMEEPESPSPKD